MNGAEFIVEFLCKKSISKVFTVTGGACTFIIDAIANNQNIDYICFQHEQSAAMAADAVWRVNNTPGVTVATSGPGATNLITGIACSYFDSIPSIHITGQVNQTESRHFLNAKVSLQLTSVQAKNLTSTQVLEVSAISQSWNEGTNKLTISSIKTGWNFLLPSPNNGMKYDNLKRCIKLVKN